MRNVISFLNMKGGVGKTTLCKEIATYLSEVEHKKVLVIDIDPQSNCTQSFFERFKILRVVDEENNEQHLVKRENINELPSIDKLFSKSKYGLKLVEKESVIKNLSDTLDIIPGDLDTVFMERETGTGAAEQKMTNFIQTNNLREAYDYIFIDCPPTYSFYTVAALLASDFYFVPLKPDAYSLLGLDLLLRVVNDMKDAYPANFSAKKIENLGVIFTMVPSESKGYKNNMQQIQEGFSNLYFFNSVFENYKKMSTVKLETFIIDRNDSALSTQLENICNEFKERMESLNER